MVSAAPGTALLRLGPGVVGTVIAMGILDRTELAGGPIPLA
jgi:hypothetical protein